MKHPEITYRDAGPELFETADRLMEQHSEPLATYLDRLLWWNERINLVSRSVPRETVREHMRHSLLVSALPSFQRAEQVVDAGTGGGLPGLPLAITHPQKTFLLNDIVTKKITAVRQMIRDLGLENVRAVDGSFEHLERKEPFLLISKHSFKLAEILRLGRDLPWQEMILYKGAELQEELKALEDKTPLGVEVHKLDAAGNSVFYQGKALVLVRKK